MYWQLTYGMNVNAHDMADLCSAGNTGAGNRYSPQFVKTAKLLHWNGLTPLMYAAAENWAPAVKLLLAHGVDVKVKCGSYRKNWSRKTAKEIAQEEDAEECFKLLEAHEHAAEAKKMAGIRKSARLAKR